MDEPFEWEKKSCVIGSVFFPFAIANMEEVRFFQNKKALVVWMQHSLFASHNTHSQQSQACPLVSVSHAAISWLDVHRFFIPPSLSVPVLVCPSKGVHFWTRASGFVTNFLPLGWFGIAGRFHT